MSNKKILILLTVLVTFVSWALYHHILTNLTLPTWDEAHHAYYGYWLRRALVDFDWHSAARYAYDQVFYPPGQSILIGIFTSFLGFSIKNVRLLSLLTLLPSTLLLYSLAQSLDKKHGRIIGFLSSLVFLTSPIILFFATVAYKEQIGLFLTLLVLWLYFKAKSERKKIFFASLAGLTLLFLHLFKYNYGLLVLITLTTIQFVRLNPSRISTLILTLLPSLLGMSLWAFSGPGRTEIIFNWLKNPNQIFLTKTTPLGHLLFVPQTLLASYALSPTLAIILVLGFFYVCWQGRTKESFQVHGFLFLLNGLLLTVQFGNQQERYLFTTFPSFVLLGTSGLVWLWTKIKEKFPLYLGKSPIRFGFLLSLAIFLLGRATLDLLRLPNLVRAIGSHEIVSPVFNEPNYQDTPFVFKRSAWPDPVIDPNRPSSRDVLDFVMKAVDVAKPIRLVGVCNEFSPLLFELYFQLERDKPRYQVKNLTAQESIITLEVLPKSQFYTYDYHYSNAWQLGEVKRLTSDPSLTLVAEKFFPELVLWVRIYQR